MSEHNVAVEIAVQDAAGVRVALDEGAQRVELCMGLGLGGLTPSIGLIEAAVDASRLAGRAGFVHVLVRPRGGDFVYDSDDVDVMIRDIERIADAGASGVVIGALTSDSRVDAGVTSELVAAAGELEVTFHRAIDAAGDPLASLDDIAELGVTRILTSGGAARSGDGVKVLAQLAERAAGRVQIMAGGGVAVDDIRALIEAGVDAVHLSARRTVTGSASGPGGGSASYDATDRDVVRAAIAATR